jgi:dTMP kinase
MKGKLIIIEGTDSSGKATQTKRLFRRLKDENINIMKIEYPNYNSNSSALVKMYLEGSFGKDPKDVSPYVASTFYAVDRYASYKTEWEKFYSEGGIILADRYTTSNMIHQAAKIEDAQDKDEYLNWLWDLEFNMYKLPVPDCVIFLDMDPEESRRLMENRKNKFTGDEEKDIHESNYGYLVNSYNNAVNIAEKYSWNKIKCCVEGNLKTIEDINNEIYDIVKNIINY